MPKMRPNRPGEVKRFVTTQVTPAQRDTYIKAAQKEGKLFSEWARARLDEAVGRAAPVCVHCGAAIVKQKKRSR